MAESREKSTSEDEEILRVAKERLRQASEASSENDAAALDDLEFRAGNQWPEAEKIARQAEGRPCIVINKLSQHLKQVTNDQRQNRPAIKVHPVDDNADVETAKIFQGLIRHIEYNSNADVAYDTGFEGAAGTGLGFLRVVTDYVDPLSFDQEILIKRLANRFAVRLDPNSKEPDGSDAMWAQIVEDVPKEAFKAEYGESKLIDSSFGGWNSFISEAPDWVSETTVKVAEYFYKEFKSAELYLLFNGQSILKDDFEKADLAKLFPDGLPINAEDIILDKRKTKIPVIKWVKHNGCEILDKKEWPGTWIPVIPIYGDEININGKRILEGIFRQAKDPQRMYNHWVSTETETIGMTPKAPWIGYEGQFEGHEEKWLTANRRNYAYLEVKPVTVAGQPAPLPTRNVFEPPVQAITNARLQSSEDIKATTGIYDAALGARSNENSGIAIERRAMQAQTSNFHFVDNLSRSMKHLGRIIVELIPKIYDVPRTQRIIGEEGDHQIVRINEAFEKNGETVIYDLSRGKYDVVVEVGPGFATKRREAVASMLDFLQAYPAAAQVIGDLLAKNMEWPGAQEISDRLKKLMPPGIAESEEDKKPLPPEVQAQMQQMDQMIQSLTEELKTKTEQINTKSLELESKERIEAMKLETQSTIELAKLESKEAIIMLQEQIRELDARSRGQQIQESNLSEAGPDQALPYEDQYPGEAPPENSMGDYLGQ